MPLKLVISSDTYNTENEAIQALYRGRNGKYELDIDTNTLNMHPAINDITGQLNADLESVKGELATQQDNSTALTEQLGSIIKETNSSNIDSTINNYLDNFATTDGQHDVIKRLLLPVISSLNESQELLDQTKSSTIIDREMAKLQKLSPVLFPKKEDISITVSDHKGTVVSTLNETTDVAEVVDYENFTGELANIDYNDFMKSYYTANEPTT